MVLCDEVIRKPAWSLAVPRPVPLRLPSRLLLLNFAMAEAAHVEKEVSGCQGDRGREVIPRKFQHPAFFAGFVY